MSFTPRDDDHTARGRLFGGNHMKLGVMAFNCSHGSTITTVPEAWKLDWADTVEIAQAVDCAGMEALLPVGRWRGYGGPSDFNNTTFESFTWASALGALTRHVTVLATCHVPLVHPLMVAKMAATIDHVTGGRFALNVVCGWFKNEFDMFGAHMRPHDDRYKYATEWLEFLKKAWTIDEEFDFDGENFHATKVWSQPKPLQKPHPPVMNAGGSPAAQEFTTRHCDMNFVILKDRTFVEGAKAQIAHLKNMAHSHGRQTRVWIHVYVVCRETEKEAKQYMHHYVYEKGDWEAAGNLLRIFGMQTETLDNKTLESHKAHFIAGHGGYPLVGTAEQIVAELGKLADIGVDGCLISCRQLSQKRSYMVNLTPRRRWRGPALGGRLQRGCRFCFAANDGEVTTSRLAEWLRPEIVYSGGKPSRWRMRSHRRALKSIGAVKVRRIGRSDWVWRLVLGPE